jgi:hypothetical protein
MYAWTESCQALRPAETDFGRHTILATNDYSVSSFGLFAKVFVSGSFNDHVAHHLFPTVDLSKQHLVRDLVLEHCKRFGVPYEERSFPELFVGTMAVQVGFLVCVCVCVLLSVLFCISLPLCVSLSRSLTPCFSPLQVRKAGNLMYVPADQK